MADDAPTELNNVYAERNRVVAALSTCFPSWTAGDPGEPGWFVVYVELPTGQASWHFRDEERVLVPHLRDGGAGCVWDEHTTVQKYERLAALVTIACEPEVGVRVAGASRSS